jgi:hypothetical protein
MEEIKEVEVIPPKTEEELVFDMEFVVELNDLSNKLQELMEVINRPFSIINVTNKDNNFYTFRVTLKTLINRLRKSYLLKYNIETLSDLTISEIKNNKMICDA